MYNTKERNLTKMELVPGKRYDVTVKQIIDKVGVVVIMEDNSTELIHISNIADCYIDDASKYVAVGDSLVARCQEGKTRPIELTLKHLNLQRKGDELDRRNRDQGGYNRNNQERSNRSFDRPKAAYRKPNRDLDSMIENFNKHYQDKFKGRDRDSKKRK